MEMKLKNIKKSEGLRLRDEVQYQEGQIVSKTLAQNEFVSLTLFAFEKERRSAPTNRVGTRWLQCWMECAELPSLGKNIGWIAARPSSMPAKVPHAVFGLERFKMLLTVVF